MSVPKLRTQTNANQDALLAGEAITSSLASLVQLNSVNPAHAGAEDGEVHVQEWLQDFLSSKGIEVERWDALPGRPNLSCLRRGKDASRTVAFITHTDTVSTSGMTIDPLGGVVRDGRLWGRGSTDAKGQVVSLLHAFTALCAGTEPPACNIQLVYTVDEEVGFGGVKNLVSRGFKADGVVIGEPTELQVVVAHKGTQRWWIEVDGRAAHSARPELGINAIHHAAALITRIQEDYVAELKKRSHPMLGSPTVNVSKIEGGTQVNLVPEKARVLIDRRTLPGETRASVEAEINAIIETVTKEYPGMKAHQLDPYMVDPPLEIAPDHPLVRTACKLSEAYARNAAPCGVPYGTDGSKLSEAGIPTLVVGPGSIAQAHTADEFIDLDELHAGARYYFDLMNSDLFGDSAR